MSWRLLLTYLLEAGIVSVFVGCIVGKIQRDIDLARERARRWNYWQGSAPSRAQSVIRGWGNHQS